MSSNQTFPCLHRARRGRTTRTGQRAAAFTLAEVLVTCGVLVLSSGVILGAISTMATVAAKNVSLNDSGINMRRAILRMTSDIEEAVEVTDVSTFNSTNNTFTTVAAGSWGNAVRIITLLPGTFYIVESAASPYSAVVPPSATIMANNNYLPAGTTTVYATYDVNSTAVATLLPTLTGSERFFAGYPIRRQPEPGAGKLGLALSAKPSAALGKISFALSSALTVAPSSVTPDANATLLEYNPAYLVRERAYVVLPNSDGTSCNLYYMADTTVPGTRVLRSPIISATQPIDIYHPLVPSAGSTNCFCQTTTPSGKQAVQILLPVSSKDYSNALLNQGRTQSAYNMFITANVSRSSLQGLITQ